VTLENVHRRLLDNLKTGVILLDLDLRLRYVNTAAEDLLEMSGRKANRLFIGDIFINAKDDIGEMQQALAHNSSFTRRKAEVHLVNGKTIHVDYTLTPFEDNGELQAALELSSLEHAQRITREEAVAAAHATTTELVRGLAHEIKNPLGGIRGAAQLLAGELPTGELTDYTAVIIEEADRLRNLVDRLSGSRQPLEKAYINVHEVLERVRTIVDAETQGSSLHIERDYDPSIPALLADAEQLIQAMLNIVRNAMQAIASPKINHTLGEIKLRTRVLRNITIGETFHRLAASIEVIDNGPGIPADLIDNIFYPMISGRPEGTGLGLSITRNIINQHNGLLECTSEPGETCFTIILPIDDVESE